MEGLHIAAPAMSNNDTSLEIEMSDNITPSNVSQVNILPKFRHETLPNPKEYIRLLEVDHLKIGDTTTQLSCKITIFHVDHAPSYYAISYVWGDKNITTTIKVNGRELQITTNGEYALRQARWRQTPARYVWMDSVCIDQYTVNEKGHQVGMMGTIYRNASCVLSCVGEHNDNSEILMRTPCEPHIPKPVSSFDGSEIYSIKDPLQNTGKPRPVLRVLNILAWSFRTLNVEKRMLIESLVAFMKRPYFTRLWIMQEVSMCTEVIVCCGVDHRPIAELFGLHLKLDDLLTLSVEHSTWMRKMTDVMPCYRASLSGLLNTTFREALNKNWKHDHRGGGFHWGYCSDQCYRYLEYGARNVITHLPLKYILVLTMHLECQDPRDKIYGILSMISWNGVSPIEPDYNANPFDVAVTAMNIIGKEADVLGLSFEPSVLSLAGSLARTMKLHLHHQTLKYTLQNQHAEQEFDSHGPNSQHLVELQNITYEIMESSSNIWKLHAQVKPSAKPDGYWGVTRCLVPHKDCQQRLRLGNLEDEIPEEYIQVRDDEGSLMALLPRGTQHGDLLLIVEVHDAAGYMAKTEFRYLVLRKVESSLYRIIGQAVGVGPCIGPNSNYFIKLIKLHLNARDALNMAVSWSQCPAYANDDLSCLTWDMAKELLDLKVCCFPLSSYARYEE